MQPDSSPGVSLLCALFLLLSVQAFAADIQVDFSPRPDEVVPLHDVANIKISLEDAAEGPVDLSVKLWAPPRARFVSTDFPLVEGTELVHMDVRLPKGELDWSYTFPIRGTYRLELEAVDAAGRSFERTVLIEIEENWIKWFFLFAFLASLFVFGLIAGRLFTGHSVFVCLVATAAAILVIPTARAAGAEAQSQLTISSPRVGELSTIRWSAADQDQQPFAPAIVTIHITQLEKNQTVFEFERLVSSGSIEIGFQFTDASDHLVEATVAPTSGQEAVRIRETVQVASAEPPLRSRLVPVVLSLIVVAAGLVTGRLSRRRRLRG